MTALAPHEQGQPDVYDLIECRDCGLFQPPRVLRQGETERCRRCRCVLRRARRNSAALACACAAAVLFAFTLETPLLSLRAAGEFSTGSVFDGPSALARFGFEEVGWLVLVTLVVAPLAKLSILILAMWGQRSSHAPRWLPWVYGWVERISPWAMVDVFLFGAFVAYTRLSAIALVEIGPAMIALGGAMLAMSAADATIDRQAIWIALDRSGSPPRETTGGDLLGCRTCGRVSRAPVGTACPRCRHRLHRRKPRSVPRTWAFVLTAALLYVPANALAVMSVTRLGRGGPHTILGGVKELFDDRLWPLAMIVLFASVIIPIAKLAALSFMLVSTRRRSTSHLLHRTQLFRFLAVIGRWSMIDIFALSVLVAVVRLGFVATVSPGSGALAFAAVVVSTMLATQCFDPRLMWDAAARDGQEPVQGDAR